MRRVYASALLVAVLVAACAREERVAPPVTAPVRVPAVPAPNAADYVARAASTDLFEIRSAELAARRASNPRLREFAREMMRDHQGTSSQLSLAARRLNLLPSARLRPEHEAMLRELLSAADFDRTYRRQQLAVHAAALNLHSGFAARGASPTLRPVAAAAVPIVRHHLDQLRTMR